MQSRNVFAGPYLERAAHLRSDPAWFDNALTDPKSRVVPVWNSRSLIADGDTPGVDTPGVGTPASGSPRAAFLDLTQIPPERHNVNDLILLGHFNGTNYFAYEIESAGPPAAPSGTRYEDLRLLAALLPPEDSGLLGYSRAMVTWRRRHRYCGTCGSKTVPAKGGHVLVCTNPACRHESFPRLDPAIIVLVSDAERALLGRQASWPRGRYSTIAGFVEPGESLEDAVAREVFEETGVTVDGIEYHSSQPWPFPSSLMLGFTAHAVTHEVHLRDQELEDARWFTRADLRSGVPLVPPSQSISYRLIEDWFDAGSDRPLREIYVPAPGPFRPSSS
jgi:NAD+ diphosphatase